jgi:outer membrane lipoprotein-sorting protein
MKRHTYRTLPVLMSAAALVLTIALAGAPAYGQAEKAAPADTLTGEKIIAHYIEVTGGRAAYDKITDRYQKAHMEAGPGATMELTIYTAKPNKMHTIGKSATMGDMEAGYDGETFWEKSIAQGPRVLEGNELAEAIREATFDRFVDWRSIFDKAELIGTDTVNGEPCYKVLMTPKIGAPQTFYFNQKTGLLVRISQVIEHQMGKIPVVTDIEDYRPVDGVMTPFRTVQKAMGQQMVMTIDSLSQNVELPKDIFNVPDDIKALIKKP